MSDIVERLRNGMDAGDPDIRAAEGLMNEAADEIERLRALLAGFVAAEDAATSYDGCWCMNCTDIMKQAREALNGTRTER